MNAPLDIHSAENLLYREALHLDRCEWDEWLALYIQNAIFWAPAWRDEVNQTNDPDSELSFIYYNGRRGLEERVWRIRSGQSVASKPLTRAVHSVSNVLLIRSDGSTADVTASFVVHIFDVRAERTHAFFGRYEYGLLYDEEVWKISVKKIFLLNDVIPSVVDFYML